MLGLFALLALIAILAAVLIIVAIAGIVALAIASLVALGIVSSSTLIAFKTGSASKGVRLAMFQICAALGAVAGLGTATGIKVFANVALGWTPVEVLGLMSGLSIGCVVGVSLSTLLKHILQRWGPRTDKGFEVVQEPVIPH